MNALCLRTGSNLFLGRASSSGTRDSSSNVSRKPRSPSAASSRSYVPSAGVDIIEEDLVKEFLKERLASGDFISRASDSIWSKGVLSEIVAEEENSSHENSMNFVEAKKTKTMMDFCNWQEQENGFSVTTLLPSIEELWRGSGKMTARKEGSSISYDTKLWLE